MVKYLTRLGIALMLLTAFTACKDEQSFTNQNHDATRVKVDQLSPEMKKVRDYVPPMAVMGHRGTIFWAPEETEASWRWAREVGVDYLESDLQMSKDGVILANHDENLIRTTNIEEVYGQYVPKSRIDFYKKHGVSEAEAKKLYEQDVASFRPFYTRYYMYEELMALDAGVYFNKENIERARPSYDSKQSGKRLYISTLEDQVRYAEGMMLKRDAVTGEREYTVTGTWDPAKPYDCLTYKFEYVADPQDKGNRPGIYIEFKESWLNPPDFVDRVYAELKRLGWNIIEKAATETEFYKNNKVNVGNTNGKVILQTFSLDALVRTAEVFQGKIPMCWLGWTGTYATDLKKLTPLGYASWINLGIKYKAHIFGPSIAGAPNNYPEMNAPWMAYLIKKSGMLNHPYSFDTYSQMGKYMGLYNWGNDDVMFNDLLTYKKPDGSTAKGVYLDGLFTNRAELTIQYLFENGFRDPKAPEPLKESAIEVLERLGY